MSTKIKVFKPEYFDYKDSEGWKAYLEKEGYVVINDIQTVEEMKIGLQLFKNDMKQVSPNFNLGKPEEMNITTCPLMYGKGMAVFNGFGQSDFMWYLRLNKKIQSIFQTYYGDKELVVSMDGFSMFVSKEQKSKPWLHIDQNPQNNIDSIQGAYNYLPVKDSSDAGFVLVPGSHKTFKPKVSHTRDWIVCEEQPVTEAVKLLLPENCLVLWNSKTIHANEGMSTSKRGLNRLTCYLTYQPRKKRSAEIKLERIKAYINGETTSHWANKCELKRYPYGFKTRYENRGFGKIIPKFNEEISDQGITKIIPPERLDLI